MLWLVRHAHGNSSFVKQELAMALSWWVDVLQNEVCEKHQWHSKVGEPLHLFCDARSTPPRAAAVLLERGQQTLYCDEEPSETLMSFLEARNDGQIMSLEILSIALGVVAMSVVTLVVTCCVAHSCSGLSTFADKFRGRRLVVWSDNKGAEMATKKGKDISLCCAELRYLRSSCLQVRPNRSITTVCSIACGSCFYNSMWTSGS